MTKLQRIYSLLPCTEPHVPTLRFTPRYGHYHSVPTTISPRQLPSHHPAFVASEALVVSTWRDGAGTKNTKNCFVTRRLLILREVSAVTLYDTEFGNRLQCVGVARFCLYIINIVQMNEDIELLRVKKLQKQKFFLIFFLTNRQKSSSCRTTYNGTTNNVC